MKNFQSQTLSKILLFHTFKFNTVDLGFLINMQWILLKTFVTSIIISAYFNHVLY